MHPYILTLLCALGILGGYPFTALAQEREVAVSSQRQAMPGTELAHYRANPLTIKVALDNTRPALTGRESLRAEVRGSVLDTADPLALTSITEPTGPGPFFLTFTGAQLNQNLDGAAARDFWLVVYTLDNGGETLDVLYSAPLVLREHWASLAAAAPPKVAGALSRAAADAIYATLDSMPGLEAKLGVLEAAPVKAQLPPADGLSVATWLELQKALAKPSGHLIRLADNITLGSGRTVIPARHLIEFGSHMLVKGKDSTLFFTGACWAPRRQIFSGFAAGEITGTFGSGQVFPEWWGLQDGEHDIAINCAIRSNTLLASNFGIRVSLAAGRYDVSAPLDLASTASTLEGAGGNLTSVVSTAKWDATWIKAERWGAADDPPNHAAMIWIGADTGSAYSYRTKVKGMDIDCGAAAEAHRAGGLKRVSGISSKAGVEENSLIHDVVISNPSGFGIGFCRHKAPGGSFSAATVNGLDISSCWIMGPTFRDMVPVYFSQWTNNCKISTTTVDMRLHKSISSGHAVEGGGDPTVYPASSWIRDYPLAAIVAQGFVSIEDVHLEGTVMGVQVLENSGLNNVLVQNVKCTAMMDRARGAVYGLDGVSGADPPANTDNYGYSCAVMIGGQGEAACYKNENWKDRVVLNNISVLGGCCYIVRDSIYGVERTSYGMGQFPAANAGGIASYVRGNAWTVPGTAVYNKDSPATDRTYFIGPIY